MIENNKTENGGLKYHYKSEKFITDPSSDIEDEKGVFYPVGQPFAEGANGTVTVVNTPEGVVVKKINTNGISKEMACGILKREHMLSERAYSSDKVYFFTDEKNQQPRLVLPYIKDAITIGEYVKKSPHNILNAFSATLTAYEELHKKGVIHGDVSTKNILIDTDGKAHIIDFGSAYLLTEKPNKFYILSNERSKYNQIPPETISDKQNQTEPFTPKTTQDYYGLAVLFNNLKAIGSGTFNDNIMGLLAFNNMTLNASEKNTVGLSNNPINRNNYLVEMKQACQTSITQPQNTKFIFSCGFNSPDPEIENLNNQCHIL